MSKTAPPKTRRTGRFRVSGFGVLAVITTIVCVALFVWPVVMIVLGAFRTGYPGDSTGWSIDPILGVVTSPSTGEALTTSFGLAALVTIISKSLSFYFAWVVARTNTPLRQLVTPVMLIVFAMPPLFFILSWALLGQVRVGMLNQFISGFTGEPSTLINTSTFVGVVFVSVLKSVAFGYFMLLGPFRAMSHRMEEAAAIAGAGRLRTFFTVNVPIMLPALGSAVIVGFIVGLEYFEAPLILGTPAGVEVLSTQIYSYLNDDYPPKFAEASGLATIMLAVLIVLLLVQGLLQRRRSFETIGGKSGADKPWDLGAWKFVGTGVFLVYVVLALVLPVFQIALASLQPFFGATSGYSFANYERLFANPRTWAALQTTGVLGVVSGLAVMILALAVIFVVRHGNRFVAGFISRTTWLPLSMPGTALALGILWVLLSYTLTRPLYGTIAAMGIALIIVAMPIAMRNIEPAAMQVSRDLEEAAWVSGSTKVRGFLVVVARLILPSFLAGWLMCGILVGGNLVMPLMVGSPLLDTVSRMTYDMYTSGKGTDAAALSCIFLVGVSGIFLVGMLLRAILVRVLAVRPDVAAPSTGGGTTVGGILPPTVGPASTEPTSTSTASADDAPTTKEHINA
ncbi:ABC transporter permease [Microbacterium sp. CPCC 204701]|uniref:ABC transporter permease n=1 Tax=Microbacterium sp. CPCC 204701 TaxID=2493084 RepID=UPI0013E2FAA7|nr:ABC transporter permease subunit [Microbacterium sp. CPCC 204701]